MNYGPLAYAIEKLLAQYAQRPPKQDRNGKHEYNVKISQCWDEIFIAQDMLVEDLKNGKL